MLQSSSKFLTAPQHNKVLPSQQLERDVCVRRITGLAKVLSPVAAGNAVKSPASAAKGRTDRTFNGLVATLLYGAGSLIDMRGPASCASCRGEGSCECPSCKGAGVVDASTVHINQVRHFANRLKLLAGIESSTVQAQQWRLTNRCKRCHGAGSLPCSACYGHGVRSGENDSG